MTAEANCFLCLQSPCRQRACPQVLASAKYESAPFPRVINSGTRQTVRPSHLMRLRRVAVWSHPDVWMHLLPLASKNFGGSEAQESDVVTIEELQVKRATVGIKSAGSGGGARSNHTPLVLLEFPCFTVFGTTSESVNTSSSKLKSRILHLC